MNPTGTLKAHPGYHGMFTTDNYAGAMPHGTRVRKRNSELGDAHPNGSVGTILGSIGHAEIGTFYFVEWDRLPRVAVGCIALKVEKTDESR
jgi:hypothetical protein